MAIKWTKPAQTDFQDIYIHISKDNSVAAERVGEALLDAVEILQDFPHMGRPGAVFGTRELVISGLPYMIVYSAEQPRITILRVLHDARLWPPV